MKPGGKYVGKEKSGPGEERIQSLKTRQMDGAEPGQSLQRGSMEALLVWTWMIPSHVKDGQLEVRRGKARMGRTEPGTAPQRWADSLEKGS